jgi:hypothetical protein
LSFSSSEEEDAARSMTSPVHFNDIVMFWI